MEIIPLFFLCPLHYHLTENDDDDETFIKRTKKNNGDLAVPFAGFQSKSPSYSILYDFSSSSPDNNGYSYIASIQMGEKRKSSEIVGEKERKKLAKRLNSSAIINTNKVVSIWKRVCLSPTLSFYQPLSIFSVPPLSL